MPQPDYDNSIMSITNSLLQYYGAKPYHATLPAVDELLAENAQNVVLLVMDGMGINVLERSLPEDAFLRKHLKMAISSVYPCTTTAATTSILTGKTPAEHGWLGWSCYFREVDKCVDLFINQESGTENQASDEHLPYKYLPYDHILSAIGAKVKTCAVWPFTPYYANTMEEICEQLKKQCSNGQRNFIYAYHEQPDYAIHQHGVGSDCVKRLMVHYNNLLETLANSLPNTLLLITADHGMTDMTMRCVEDYPAIHAALLRHICIEPRCCSMYVKEKHKAAFPAAFVNAFGDQFKLFTHDEFLQSGLLGPGVPHQKTADFVGDYVAAAVKDTALWYKDIRGSFHDYKGNHAGLTKDELTVPLIAIQS